MYNRGYEGKRVQRAQKVSYIDIRKPAICKVGERHRTRNELKRITAREVFLVGVASVIASIILCVTVLAAETISTAMDVEEEVPNYEHEPATISYQMDSEEVHEMGSQIALYDAAPEEPVIEEEPEPDPIITTRLGVVVNSYDPNVDYQKLINDTYGKIEGDAENAEMYLSLCEVYEAQRNYKIEDTDSTAEPTSLFSNGNSYEEIDRIINPPWYDYTESDVKQLAALIYAEGGSSSWVCWEHCLAIGSVVMNRVVLPNWGDTIHDVIWRPGQYPATRSNTKYNDRSYEAALYVLENGPTSDAVYQANFKQGTEVIAVYDYPGHSTTYICK